MNNLFRRLFLVRSFLLSRKHHYLFAMGSFHFHTGQAKLSQAHFYSIQFLKVRYFPGKIDNKPLPGVLKLLSRFNRLSKQSFRPIFIWCGTSRDFIACLTASRPKKLVPLVKKLIKRDSAVVLMLFQELCHLLAIFLDCSSSPSLSLLISKPTLLQKDFVVFFRLGVVYENGQAFFSSLEAFISKIQGKTVSTILVDHDFC